MSDGKTTSILLYVVKYDEYHNTRETDRIAGGLNAFGKSSADETYFGYYELLTAQTFERISVIGRGISLRL